MMIGHATSTRFTAAVPQFTGLCGLVGFTLEGLPERSRESVRVRSFSGPRSISTRGSRIRSPQAAS